MSSYKQEVVDNLMKCGISYEDALNLRKISMTLHRWHELECGDSNDFASEALVRGRKANGVFEYDDNGTPFIERHVHTDNKVKHIPVPDKEKGALKRLDEIMKRYAGFGYYIQGDPRGASLYILRPGDIRDGATPDSCYTNGVAVYK